MPITLSPLERDDIPTFIRIELDAFRSHPRIPMLWPRGYTDDLYAYYEANKNESFDDPECQFMKATDDDTGKIVAVSEWSFCLDVTKQAEKEAVDQNGQQPANWPIDGNWKLKHFFRLNSEKWTNEYLKAQPYIKLEFLVVDPQYQSRGVGTKLLSWGVGQADKTGARVGLESTPAGLALYQSFGFREVEVIKADMQDFGYNKPYDSDAAKRVWMIREPASSGS